VSMFFVCLGCGRKRDQGRSKRLVTALLKQLLMVIRSQCSISGGWFEFDPSWATSEVSNNGNPVQVVWCWIGFSLRWFIQSYQTQFDNWLGEEIGFWVTWIALDQFKKLIFLSFNILYKKIKNNSCGYMLYML